MENSKFNFKIKDIFDFLKNIKRQISKRCLIIEFSDQNLKLVEAKLIEKNISFRSFRNIKLPSEATNQGVPNDPEKMSQLILDLMEEENIQTKSASVVLNSESIFIKNIFLPQNLTKTQAIKYLISSSNNQLPIPISQLDFDLIELNRKSSDPLQKEFILIAIPKKLTNIISKTLNMSGLDLKLIDFNAISNTRLLYKEQRDLKDKQFLLLLDFKSDATFLTLLDKNGPLRIDRISSIREYPHNFSENYSDKMDYLELSKLELKIIVKDINKILKNYFKNGSDISDYEVFIIGPNSAHPKLVELLGSLLSKNVYLISPTNCEGIYDATYDDDINEFFISSLIGTGLGLTKSINISLEKSQDFKYIKKFIFNKSNDKVFGDIEKKTVNSNIENKFNKTKKEDNNSGSDEIKMDNNSKGNVNDTKKQNSYIKDKENYKNGSKKNSEDSKEFKFDKKFLD